MTTVQNMTLDVDAVTGGKPVRIPQSRKEKIQAELKLLEWHKMANAAAIKGALLQTKTTKVNSPQKKPSHALDDERWIKKVIKQEHTRPLNVAKDFVLDYEQREKENADRLTNQVDRHISTLKTLRTKLESRHELKTRSDEYRTWQRGFLPKKHAIMIGKTLEEFEASQPPPTANLDDPRDAEINDEAMQKSETLRMQYQNKNSSSQELSTVLDSLSRLADLESRISGLEKENKYDTMKARERPAANERNSIEFRKARVPQPGSGMKAGGRGGGGPVGISYSIRDNKPTRQQRGVSSNSWKVNMPNQQITNRSTAAGTGSAAVRMKQQRGGGGGEYGAEGEEEEEEDDGAGGNTFITAQQDDSAARARASQRIERARQLEMASAGQKGLRDRLQQKRARTKEQLLGQKKHEAAMKEMARRKHENSKRAGAGANNNNNNAKVGVSAAARNARGGAAAGKGISSGTRTKNKHLQEFEKMKSNYRKKKDAYERRAIKQQKDTNIGKRFVSQTAPAYDNRNHPQYRAAAAARGGGGGGGGAIGGRKPATKTSGTVTRRTDKPTRRIGGNNNNAAATDPLMKLPPSSAPAIAVTGLGGLRVIKGNGAGGARGGVRGGARGGAAASRNSTHNNPNARRNR